MITLREELRIKYRNQKIKDFFIDLGLLAFVVVYFYVLLYYVVYPMK